LILPVVCFQFPSTRFQSIVFLQALFATTTIGERRCSDATAKLPQSENARLFACSIMPWGARCHGRPSSTARRRLVGLFDDGVDRRAGDSWRWRAVAPAVWLYDSTASSLGSRRMPCIP
jgi:hypothetical protein